MGYTNWILAGTWYKDIAFDCGESNCTCKPSHIVIAPPPGLDCMNLGNFEQFQCKLPTIGIYYVLEKFFPEEIFYSISLRWDKGEEWNKIMFYFKKKIDD